MGRHTIRSSSWHNPSNPDSAPAWEVEQCKGDVYVVQLVKMSGGVVEGTRRTIRGREAFDRWAEDLGLEVVR